MKSFLLFILCTALNFLVSAQDNLKINTEGMPPITTYEGTDYNGYNQVWDITQDEKGLIYIATSYSLHEFDGTEWRSIKIPEGVVPRCFAKSSSGKIFLGGIGIMGYLDTGKDGLTEFYSIADKLPEGIDSYRLEFINALNGKIFFSGLNSIIVYDEDKGTLQYFDTNNRSYPNFVLNNKIYFKFSGLLTYENDTLVSVKAGDHFIGKAISDFMVYKEDSAIAITPDNKYHYFNGDTAIQKEYYENSFFADKFLYKLLNISENYNAICYLSAGLVITDRHWNPILHIDESAGINQQVYKAFLDAENNLWLATNFGVAVVELASRYSQFDLTADISGDVTSFEESNGRLYTATTTGIFHKKWRGEQNAVERQNQKFEKVAGSDIYNDHFLKGSSPILVKAYQTIGQIIDNNYERLYTRSETESQLIYLTDSSYALTIGKDGSSMQVFHHNGQQWSHHKSLENSVLPARINKMQMDRANNVIWGTNSTSLFSFNVSKNLDTIEDFRAFSTSDGLPANTNNYFTSIGKEVFFLTERGVFIFNPESQGFEKSNIFNNYFEEVGISKLVQGPDSTFWYIAGNSEKGQIKIRSGQVEIDPKMTHVMPVNANEVYYSEGKGALYGSTNSIGFLQENKEESYGFRFKPMIRQLDIIKGKDSTIFNGVFVSRDSIFSYNQDNPIQLEYENNAVKFTYSIPYYRHPEKIQYQYQLDGFQGEWSEWTNKTQKEYTNLPAGNYIFNVRARNGFRTESEIGQIKIKIIAPWYQTWWAYLLYLLLFAGFIRALLYFNSKRLKAKNEELELTIAERVKEIKEQQKLITKSLSEKEALLKEIHHRVKNNLQIIANLLYLQSGKFNDETIKNVLEEGQGRVRSMALIHQKLYENEDLKSIPFGEYILELVNEIKASFGHKAAPVRINVKAEEAFFDVDSAVPLGLIVNELTTNAFKYAFDEKESGQFNIYLTKSENEYELHVSDNGRGIPAEIDIRRTRSLGLRLVRILSEQLEGEYTFESNEGLSFKLRFVA